MSLSNEQPVESPEGHRTQAAPPARSSSLIRTLLAQRSFVAAVVVLGVAALGLNSAVQGMQVYFKKQPVALRHKLDNPDEGIPSRLGHWVKVSEQTTLNADMQHTLGTDQFCFRTYVDERKIGRENAAILSDIDVTPQRAKERAILNATLLAKYPEAFVSFNITYYTGLIDTVAHIPDRCMVADGYDTHNAQTESWPATLSDGSKRDIQFRYMRFEDQTGRGRIPRNVLYFFHCNGQYADGPIAVRKRLQNLLERNAYYSKIELMTDEPAAPQIAGATVAPSPQSSRLALEAMEDLLSSALPDVERCLPDWNAVQATAARK